MGKGGILFVVKVIKEIVEIRIILLYEVLISFSGYLGVEFIEMLFDYVNFIC